MVRPLSSPLVQLFEAGKLRGTIYTYPNVGDALPTHVHPPEANHITIIMNGQFRCMGPGIEGDILTVGQVIIWPANIPHGFEALEENSRMLQISTG
jgi:quercetin dioxygenase-like cupin family protein